ncbi:MAG: NADH-quinone oxidoreductase subunit L [Thermomicrobiaceae bacterium]
MSSWLFLIPLLPLAAAVINFLFGRWFLQSASQWLAILAVAGSFVLSVFVFLGIASDEQAVSQHLYTWIPAGDFDIPVNLFVDQLTATMLLVVSGVGLLVHIYSVGYMHGDPGLYRFFSYLPLFVFSMLMLIMADNFLVLFVFWEGVGLCSFLLIGFWYRRRSAASAAKKAFIVNRVGDFGFGIGILLIFVTYGTIEYAAVFDQVGSATQSTITIIALLLFTGAIGKSAQLPLFVWLPDAMEGPTPVSALIHAATMVTAGIFVIARAYPIVSQSADAMFVISVVGAATAFVAATIAVTQYDIKKVVAYSTVSQLGFMAFALGTGAWVAAIFHLVTHAFFKGLLFLGAGSVIHGMHEEQDMRKMGGLKKYMPLTYWTFLIGAAANAGIIPLAGFWSKDEIILGAWIHDQPYVMAVGFITAFFTSLYMFRAVFMTFHGEERFDTEHVHPHESPAVMTLPLVVLAVFAATAGFIGFPPEDGWFHHFIDPSFPGIEHPHVALSTTLIFGGVSTVIAVSGLLIQYSAYVKRSISPKGISELFGPLYKLAANRWYLDEIYDFLIVRPLFGLSMFLWKFVDAQVIDGTVNGVGTLVTFTSQQWRKAQTGLIANYVFAIALGAVVIIGAFMLFGSNLFQ